MYTYYIVEQHRYTTYAPFARRFTSLDKAKQHASDIGNNFKAIRVEITIEYYL